MIPLEQFGQEVPEGKHTYTIRAIAVADDQVGGVAVFRYDIEPHADLPLAQRFQERLHYEVDLDNIEHIDKGFMSDLGDRQLTEYHIAGHSKGCLVLLDEPNGILISGDAIGSNGPTIVDALWLQMSEDTVDEYRLNDHVNVISIQVVAPDGATSKVYSLTIAKGESQ